MQIGNQSANSITNIEGNVENFSFSATFSGDVHQAINDIKKEIKDLESSHPEIKNLSHQLTEEIEKPQKNISKITDIFGKISQMVKQVEQSQETISKLLKIGAKIGSFIALFI